MGPVGDPRPCASVPVETHRPDAVPWPVLQSLADHPSAVAAMPVSGPLPVQSAIAASGRHTPSVGSSSAPAEATFSAASASSGRKPSPGRSWRRPASTCSRANDPSMESRLVADTFLRWKGLGRPAIIVADLPKRALTQWPVRLNIALTRAMALVRFVGTRFAIAGSRSLSNIPERISSLRSRRACPKGPWVGGSSCRLLRWSSDWTPGLTRDA